MSASEGAIRKRVARGTLRSELGADGERYVYLNGEVTKGRTRPPPVSPKHSGLRERRSLSAKDRIIAILENQLAEERAASGELRRIIAALTQRIPQLEAQSSPKS